MFSELKQRITLENLEKIRNNQNMFEDNDGQSSSNNSDSFQSNQELKERLQVFRHLITSNDQRKRNRSKHNQSMNFLKTSKERQIFQEQRKIDKQMHEKQIEYLKERNERQKAALQSQIQKLTFSLKKYIKDDGLVHSLRKENRQLLQLQAQSRDIAENILMENSNLKKEIFKLKAVVKQKQQKEANIQAHKYIESETQKKLKETLTELEREKTIEMDRKKQLEGIIQKLRIQNDQLIRQLDRFKINQQQKKAQIEERNKEEISKIQQENRELKRRNQKLEQSFIQHLTQTSLNLQQTLKNGTERPAKNTTMYLQESPIRSRSRQQEKNRILHQQQDPQKIFPEKCDCSKQLIKLRGKLDQANAKIVNLLRQKCQNHRYR